MPGIWYGTAEMTEPYISICIPTYEMGGCGAAFLKHSFRKIWEQTYRDFEVVVSDQSRDDNIRKLCEAYSIRHYFNPAKCGRSSINTNNAMRHARGTLLKILFQDDFLYSPDSLQRIVDTFDIDHDTWLVTGCEHTRDGITCYRPFYPKYNNQIHTGANTISSPSVLTIKNEGHLEFDENLVWLMDCEYYSRYYDTHGLPKILNEINVVNRTWENQVSNTTGTFRKIWEWAYVEAKVRVARL
jgi:glycosyltransferase involved in cell wall biosynthesis